MAKGSAVTPSFNRPGVTRVVLFDSDLVLRIRRPSQMLIQSNIAAYTRLGFNCWHSLHKTNPYNPLSIRYLYASLRRAWRTAGNICVR